MKVRELLEGVSKEIFKPGFERTKELPGGKYILVATPGRVLMGEKQSDQFRIEIRTLKGTKLGWVNFKDTRGSLEAIDLNIDKQFRRRGFATEMYAFARELGNSIVPSEKQTALGKAFWNKDHSK